MRTRFLLVMLVVAAATACDDSEILPPEPPVQPEYLPLTTEAAVLQNLERAYNDRNISRYEAILDDGFTFFLSDGDVNSGLPPEWDRSVEVTATRNLFSTTKVGDLPLVKRIQMDVQFENGIQWSPGTMDGWFNATLFYDFQITVEQEGQSEDLTYYPVTGSKARFTVRNAGTDESPKWQLVEWHDLGGEGNLAAALSGATTEQTTWGKVKSLFR